MRTRRNAGKSRYGGVTPAEPAPNLPDMDGSVAERRGQTPFNLRLPQVQMLQVLEDVGAAVGDLHPAAAVGGATDGVAGLGPQAAFAVEPAAFVLAALVLGHVRTAVEDRVGQAQDGTGVSHDRQGVVADRCLPS